MMDLKKLELMKKARMMLGKQSAAPAQMPGAMPGQKMVTPPPAAGGSVKKSMPAGLANYLANKKKGK